MVHRPDVPGGESTARALTRVAFRRGTAVWVVLTCGAGFCAMLFLAATGDPADDPGGGASSFSRSAVGHSAFYQLLQARGYRVDVNRDRAPLAHKWREGDLMLLVAPNSGPGDIDRIAQFAAAASGTQPLLVVLPKWSPRVSRTERGWIDQAHPLPRERTTSVLRATVHAEGNGRIVRAVADRSGGASRRWRNDLADTADTVPDIDAPQLMTGFAGELNPLVDAAGGVLLGQFGDGGVAVLSDPDLLANHGLHRGDNAALALAVIDRLLPDGGVVLFDETLHGFAIDHSLWRLLFQPPYVAATLLALAAVALIVWRSAVRFGAPLARESGPDWPGGATALIVNAGRLLAAGGHPDLVARRYAEATYAEARRRLRLPPPAQLQDSAEPSAGEREGTPLARKEPSAGEREGMPLARQEPSAGEREGMPLARQELNAIAARRGIHARLPELVSGRPLAVARAHQRWMREMFGDG